MRTDYERFDTVIYINGVPHNTTGLASSFFADCAELPNRRCSQHNIGTAAVVALKNGQKVKTLGNWYSMQPDRAAQVIYNNTNGIPDYD